MKASELIRELEQLKVTHGDLEVIDENGDSVSVEFDAYGGDDPAFVVS